MSRLRFLVVAPILVVLTAGSAKATVYYVRTDGHDANCTGLSDAAYPGSGSAQACALRTVGKGETKANCGDTVYVRAGQYFETGFLTISDSCTEGTPKRIIGDGSSQVTLFLVMAGEITGCTLKSGKSNVYECSVPSGSDTSLSDGKKFYQLVTSAVDLEAKAGVVKESEGGWRLVPSGTGFLDIDRAVLPESLDGVVHSPARPELGIEVELVDDLLRADRLSTSSVILFKRDLTSEVTVDFTYSGGTSCG